jgi:hypothetical protein
MPAPAEQAPSASPSPSQDSAAGLPAGQWVYTDQYGWVWMPYSDAYTYAPADGYGEPYMYVYYPAYGWSWVVAPWVWGWGPWPFFGVGGPWHFGWYGHGWWRSPWHWHYAPAVGYHGLRPAPFRAGYVAPRGYSVAGHGGASPHVSGGFHGGGHR